MYIDLLYAVYIRTNYCTKNVSLSFYSLSLFLALCLLSSTYTYIYICIIRGI